MWIRHFIVVLLSCFDHAALVDSAFRQAGTRGDNQSDPASSGWLYHLTLLDLQLTDKREVRVLLNLHCANTASDASPCPAPRLLLNLTRAVGLYAWSESDPSALRREAESALCQFSGKVSGESRRFTFASLNLCRGPFGIVDTGRSQFFVQPWPLPSGGLNLTADSFTAAPGRMQALNAAFSTGGKVVQLTVTARPGGTMSHQRSLGDGPSLNNDDPFARRRCVTRTPPEDYWSSSDHHHAVHQPRHRRFRRSAPATVTELVSHRFVEILFVVDSSIVAFHRNILDDFVFGILGIAQGVFRDPQLEESIELSLASVYRLTAEEESKLMSHDTDQVASDLLDSFNAWSAALHRSRFGQSVSWDISVLLTRKYLFSFVDYDGKLIKDPVLGITTYRSMCEMQRNGILLQDIGLQSGFSLAHELGHTFNMYHDGSPVCSRKLYPHEAKGNFVMDSSLHPSTYPWTWSVCSKLHLQQFLRTSQSDCTRQRSRPVVLHQQKSKRSSESRFYPRFTVDEQCRLLFGAEAAQCDSNLKTCSTLWCRVSVSHNKSLCWSKKVVWAPGTPCGTDQICLDGECVPAIHGAIDGGWSQWSEWTNCSADCGGGVRWRRRFCDSPKPRRGGAFCHGQRAVAETCSRGVCPKRTSSKAEASTGTGSTRATARDMQCMEFALRQSWSDDTTGGSGGIRSGTGQLTATALHPRLSSDSQCQSVTCSVHSSNAETGPRLARIFTVDRVRDGAACHPFDYGVCIGGVCQPTGCDGVLHSNSRWDACGVCDGGNETCHLEINSFTVDFRSGTSYLHTFRQGSSSIELKTESGSGRFCTLEIMKSSNYSSDSWTSVEALYFNGHPMKTNLGASILYSQKQLQNNIENGPLVEIISGVGSRRLEEEYLASGIWIVLIRQQDDWHLRGIGRLASNLSVRISLFDPDRRQVVTGVEKRIRVKSRAYLPNLRVRMAIIDECSRRCQGRQSLEHVCEDISAVEVNGAKRLPLSVCLAAKPPLLIPPLPPPQMCNTHCRFEWRLIPGNCSARCGQGRAVDRYVCVLSREDGSSDVLPEPDGDYKDEYDYCDSRPVRILQRECTGECRPVAWRLSPWSPCSKTCGSGGTRNRFAVCKEPHEFGNRQWPDSECQHLPIQSNLTENCANSTIECPNWKVSEWSSCDAYCASGFERRSVYCRWKSEPAPLEMCQGTMPNTERNCTGWCIGRWVAGNWSECRLPCQNGRRFRQVNCVIGGKKVNALNCPRASMPTYLQDCSHQCVHWVYSQWDHCSATCGSQGRQARLALCANASNQLINSDDCRKWIGPATDTVRPCFVDLQPLPECPGSGSPARRYDWRVAEWSICSHSCGSSGVRFRRVDCLAQDGSNKSADEAECSRLALKPSATQKCNRHIHCPYWVFHQWSKCLTECDQGIQLRSVHCHQGGQIVQEHLCSQSNRPIDLRPCNSSVQCPGKWITGEWSECSQSCGTGPGIRLRRVACQSLSGQQTSEVACPLEERPIDLMKCGQLPCPTWVPTGWSDCTGLCGNGTRTRDLHCRWSNGSLTSNATLCSSEAQPVVLESCKLDGPTCNWRVGPWSRCQLPASAICTGGRRGHRLRTVECRLGDGGPVLPEALCLEQSLRRPRTRRRCRASSGDLASTADIVATCGSVRKRHADGDSDIEIGATDRRPAWRIGPWSACSASCGRGYQTRRLTPCNAIDLDANGSCRQSRRRPRNRRRCFLAFCPHAWTADPWSACSVSCGRGWVTRRVVCQRFTPEGWRAGPAADTANACSEQERPQSRQACSLIHCPSGGNSNSRLRGPFWEVGDYGECRYTGGGCGEGERRRTVRCSRRPGLLDWDKRNDGGCHRDEMPPERDACVPSRCHAGSCLELKSMMRIKVDGQYRLRIGGQDVRVYCFDMETRKPREFITLPMTLGNSDRSPGQNFAVIHNIGLTDPAPSACPSAATLAGFSRAACSQPGAPCRVTPDRPGAFVSGMTAFRKYRLLLSPRLQVDATDDTFAISWKSFVPGGRAGDCFSRLAGCSVGSFSIDLTGTDFALDSSANSWLGQNATTLAVSYLDRQRVQGICGGLCGFCKLHNDRLLLTVLDANAVNNATSVPEPYN